MCFKCLFRAGSLLGAFVLLCSGSSKSISFPQALLRPTLIYTVTKIKTSTSWLNNGEFVELYTVAERPKAKFLQVFQTLLRQRHHFESALK